ncbi:MAG: alanine-zipper protein [Gammaproteobacteria bacterium]|jgi:uncharacterized lipoprotein NlpE involved in copper resistance|tara:strand:- start:1108 stop:1350 length:243 start_codon:yes stop_codon:yes gene_type:complete
MSKPFLFLKPLIALSFCVVALFGCASQPSTSDAKATTAIAEARKASSEATTALRTAQKAQATAEANTARIERMFKQTMQK